MDITDWRGLKNKGIYIFLCREERRWEFWVLCVRGTGSLILLYSPRTNKERTHVRTVRQRQDVKDSLHVFFFTKQGQLFIKKIGNAIL
jgi:hypothetical protein